MALGNGHRLVPAGQRLLGCGNGGALGPGDISRGYCRRARVRRPSEMTRRETPSRGLRRRASPEVREVTTGSPNRPPATLTRLYTRLQAHREPLERSLVGRMVLRFDIIDGSDRAAVLALNALLSLIPLAVLGVAIAHVNGVTSSNYADGLERRAQPAWQDGGVRARRSRRRLRRASAAATVVGILGLIWTAFGFTSALWRVYDRAWGGHSHAGRARGCADSRGSSCSPRPTPSWRSRAATWDTAPATRSRCSPSADPRLRGLGRLALAAARAQAALARRRPRRRADRVRHRGLPRRQRAHHAGRRGRLRGALGPIGVAIALGFWLGRSRTCGGERRRHRRAGGACDPARTRRHGSARRLTSGVRR